MPSIRYRHEGVGTPTPTGIYSGFLPLVELFLDLTAFRYYESCWANRKNLCKDFGISWRTVCSGCSLLSMAKCRCRISTLRLIFPLTVLHQRTLRGACCSVIFLQRCIGGLDPKGSAHYSSSAGAEIDKSSHPTKPTLIYPPL